MVMVFQVPSGGAVASSAGGAAAPAAAAAEEKAEEKEEEKVRINDLSACWERVLTTCTIVHRRSPTTTWASVCSTKTCIVSKIRTLRITHIHAAATLLCCMLQ